MCFPAPARSRAAPEGQKKPPSELLTREGEEGHMCAVRTLLFAAPSDELLLKEGLGIGDIVVIG